MEGFKKWYKEPFADEMDALDWALFVGFIIVVIVFWQLVLRHVLQED